MLHQSLSRCFFLNLISASMVSAACIFAKLPQRCCAFSNKSRKRLPPPSLPQTKTDSTTCIGHDTHGFKKSSRKCTRTQLVLKRRQNLKAISYRSGVQQRTSTLVSLLCSFLIPSFFSAARHVRAPLSRADLLKTGSQEPVLLSNKHQILAFLTTYFKTLIA